MKNFIRVVEDFECENCGATVKGDGYTNHCPHCLYSKHVDLQVPGDRSSSCLGMMEPTRAETAGSEYILIHRCIICQKEIRNRSGSEDNVDEIIKLIY